MTLDGVRRALEPAIRRVMHLYWRFARAMTLGVRALVIDEQRPHLSGQAQLCERLAPAGRRGRGRRDAEPRRWRASCARRAISSSPQPPQLYGIFFNDRDSRRDHVALFVVRGFRQAAAPVPDHEIVAHGFFAVDALPNDTTAGTRARIIEVLGGAPVSERW